MYNRDDTASPIPTQEQAALDIYNYQQAAARLLKTIQLLERHLHEPTPLGQFITPLSGCYDAIADARNAVRARGIAS